MMQPDESSMNPANKLGVVIAGSLTHGIEVKLDGSASVEDMAVGRYVTIKGQKRRFFGMITDVTLGVVDEQINVTPADASDPFLSRGSIRYQHLRYLACFADADHRWRCRWSTGRAAAGKDRAQPFLDGRCRFSERMWSWSSAEKMKRSSLSALRWIWRPKFAWTWRNSSNVPTVFSVKAARARPS